MSIGTSTTFVNQHTNPGDSKFLTTQWLHLTNTWLGYWYWFKYSQLPETFIYIWKSCQQKYPSSSISTSNLIHHTHTHTLRRTRTLLLVSTEGIALYYTDKLDRLRNCKSYLRWLPGSLQLSLRSYIPIHYYCSPVNWSVLSTLGHSNFSN